jgi:ABC-2 type transport system ATP-binding protein
MTAAIEFQGVVKRYGGVAVLDGLELEVPAGSAFALVGANGAGKTTCIKTLLDFVQVDAGSVRIFGVDHRDHRSRARLVYLPERFLPPHHLSGLEFLAYFARLHGGTFDAQAARRAALSLDLDPGVLGRPARSYSKGMAQKLGLAACLLSGKDLMVLDEPTSGLDPKARLLVKRLLSALHEQGRTLFFSTHVLADVHAVCDRLAVLHRGRVLFAGTPQQCLECYGGASLEEAYLNCVDAAAAHAGTPGGHALS